MIKLEQQIIESYNFLKRKPDKISDRYGSIEFFFKNNSCNELTYDYVCEIYISNDYTQIKMRDCELLVEYHLCMTDKNFYLNVWFDGTPKMKIAKNCEIETTRYDIQEDEYFQSDIVKKLNFNFETVCEVQLLHETLKKMFRDRVYESV